MPKLSLSVAAILVLMSLPALASVQVLSMVPSPAAPRVIGTKTTWTASATDTGAGPLAFQFNVAPPGGILAMVKDFNLGTNSSGTWTSQPFVWTPTGVEGTYQIQVVAKDFGSGQTSSTTINYQVTPLVTGSTPVVVPTANPLVALFSAPACPAGSKMRVNFTKHGTTITTLTPWSNCTSGTMTFEIAGMYESSNYAMYSQTMTGNKIINGPPVNFLTGPLPNIAFPTFTLQVTPTSLTDTPYRVLLEDVTFPGQNYYYPDVATDLWGHILWYYEPANPLQDQLPRPVPKGVLTIESGNAWNAPSQNAQLLRQVDWAGNIVKETNTGAIQQGLLALGATDAQPCSAIARPAPVGAGCLDDFDHEFIAGLPNGYYAVIADIEKIYPPGTQGDNTGLPVDIIGNMIIVLDSNWKPVWYFDAFQHAGGGNQLDINRGAVLGETCSANQLGCPPGFLLGSGIAPLAHDWLHGNSLNYWPAPQNHSTKGDLIWSSRHQDWVMRIDYQDGTGTGNLVWRMGPSGDFQFNNIYGNSWPWFSHQHQAGVQLNNGYMMLFDNGNTRVSQQGGNSRGMVLRFDESTKQVTPVLSVDLGVYTWALGSAQWLGNNNYFFLAGYVGQTTGYAIEILPTSGTDNGTQVYNLASTVSYRAFRMPNLYASPPQN